MHMSPFQVSTTKKVMHMSRGVQVIPISPVFTQLLVYYIECV